MKRCGEMECLRVNNQAVCCRTLTAEVMSNLAMSTNMMFLRLAEARGQCEFVMTLLVTILAQVIHEPGATFQ